MLLKGVLSKDSTNVIDISVDAAGSVADLRRCVAVRVYIILIRLESEQMQCITCRTLKRWGSFER